MSKVDPRTLRVNLLKFERSFRTYCLMLFWVLVISTNKRRSNNVDLMLDNHPRRWQTLTVGPHYFHFFLLAHCISAFKNVKVLLNRRRAWPRVSDFGIMVCKAIVPRGCFKPPSAFAMRKFLLPT